MTVAVVLPFAVRLTVDGLRLQLASKGRPAHTGVPLPVNPAIEVNVSVVSPDCPGWGIAIVEGFAETVNPPTFSVIGDEVEVE